MNDPSERDERRMSKTELAEAWKSIALQEREEKLELRNLLTEREAALTRAEERITELEGR